MSQNFELLICREMVRLITAYPEDVLPLMERVRFEQHLSICDGCTAYRGGPRNSDRLLRWDPDQGEGVWHATEETELSC